MPMETTYARTLSLAPFVCWINPLTGNGCVEGWPRSVLISALCLSRAAPTTLRLSAITRDTWRSEFPQSETFSQSADIRLVGQSVSST